MTQTVLVVDDLEDNRAMLARRLERAGYRIIEATDGAEAVAITVNDRPDLILMDISMPGVDGIEAWRIICEMCDHPPPAIALTATCIADVKHTCLEIGFRAFLTKPVDFAELIETVKVCFEPTGQLAA